MLFKIERFILNNFPSNFHSGSIPADTFRPYSNGEIHAALKTLDKKGYIKFHGSSIDLSNFSLELTTDGIFFSERLYMSFFKNLFWPFITSVLTTVVTHYLIK